jgi:hypothetical protein
MNTGFENAPQDERFDVARCTFPEHAGMIDTDYK